MRTLIPLSLLAVAALAPRAHAASPWGTGTVLCSIADSRVTEASGIAMSRVNKGVFYVHNDSGDTARFFAVNKAGQTVATVNVTNAAAVDWEDIACGYDKDCRRTVYLADIGDNDANRAEVQIYAVDEPTVSATGADHAVSAMARILRFHYPDGPHDAETLLADWMGRALYVVTKVKAGTSTVFRLEPVWDGPVQTAAKIGTVTFADPIPQFFGNLCTGGDIAPDGTRMILRTYQAGYEWVIPKGKKPEDVIGTPYTQVALVLEQQGEAICYGLDSKTLLTTSEKKPTPVYMYKRK